MQHAKLSASSSARWLICPGSVRASQKYKASTSSFAEYGTASHELGEICLKDFDKSPIDYLGQTLNDAPNVEVDKEMVTCVEGYVDYVRSFSGDLFVEERVDYSEWVKEGFGTSDAIVVNDDVCRVIDLKMGTGVEVYAENNSQAMLYALGVISGYGFMYDFETVELHIYQPRRNHYDVWTTTRSELLVWAEWVRERALLTAQDDAPFQPSEKGCVFCSHKANCKALYKHTESVISAEFDDLTLPDAATVDIGLVLQNKKLIESWLKAVEQNAFEKLNNGESVPGYKLVAGRSLRKWADESKAFKDMQSIGGFSEDELQTRKFLSVAQAEKLVGKADFLACYSDLVIKPDGAPTLVPESDKRPSISDVSCDFENIC